MNDAAKFYLQAADRLELGEQFDVATAIAASLGYRWEVTGVDWDVVAWRPA